GEWRGGAAAVAHDRRPRVPGAGLCRPHAEEAPKARLRASSTRYGAVSKHGAALILRDASLRDAPQDEAGEALHRYRLTSSRTVRAKSARHPTRYRGSAIPA